MGARFLLVVFMVVSLSSCSIFGNSGLSNEDWAAASATALKGVSGTSSVDLTASNGGEGDRYLQGTVVLAGPSVPEADGQLEECLTALTRIIAADSRLKTRATVAVSWRLTDGTVVSVKDLGLNPSPSAYDLIRKYGS